MEGDKAKELHRAAVISRNKTISRHAARKELTSAQALYEEAIKDDGHGANTHTYCAMMNAYIRCGDVEGASTVFASLQARKFEPDVVSYTTMIKGWCQHGQINRAIDLFDEMIAIATRRNKPQIRPNIRTVNTILRGCLAHGLLTHADYVFHRMKDLAIGPDASSCEHMTALLCQSLSLSRVLPMIGRLTASSDKPIASEDTTKSNMGLIYMNIARAASILCEWKNCKKYLKLAETALLQAETSLLTDPSEVEGDNDSDDGQDNIVTGGKKGWKGKNEDDPARYESLINYRLHRHEELKLDIHSIQTYLERQQFNQNPTSSQPLHQLLSIIPNFIRALAIDRRTSAHRPALVSSDTPAEESILITKQNCCISLEKFGFFHILERIHMLSPDKSTPIQMPKIPSMPKSKVGKKAGATVSLQDFIASSTSSVNYELVFPSTTLSGKILTFILELYVSHFNRSTGKLNFPGLLQESRAILPTYIIPMIEESPSKDKVVSSSKISEKRPMKLEICSGNGEWATTQAEKDTHSDWITVELRQDRVYETFIRTVYKDISNMIVLGGDANSLLTLIPDASLDHIYVNHPEPPQQTGKVLQSEASHLLSGEFFHELVRILKPEGKITIVTDNSW